MKKKKLMIWVTAAAVVVILFLVLFFFFFEKTNGITYKTEKVKKGNIEAIVSTTGTVNPKTIVEVGSQVSGKILKLHVDFNSQVTQGQILAEIDSSQILTRIRQNEANFESSKASLEKSKVNMNNIKKKFERALKLFEKELISFEEKESIEAQYLSSKADVQASEARLLQSQSQLESSKVDLDYTIIKSPIEGIVILRNINVGQTVAASFQAPVLFKIANNLNKMQVECSIDEADIGRIKEGQEVRFTVDAYPDDKFSGTVLQVRYSPEVIQNVVTYTTIVETENPRLKLRPGMTATVSIVSGKATDVIMVSNAALRFTPQLSQEEMKEIFEKMRAEMIARRGANPNNRQGGSNRTGGFMGQRPSGQGSNSSRRRQPTRVWIMDEKGQIKMINIRTGVTDDSWTEVKRGEVKEGQVMLTGIKSGKASSSSNRNIPRMMFGRR